MMKLAQRGQIYMSIYPSLPTLTVTMRVKYAMLEILTSVYSECLYFLCSMHSKTPICSIYTT